MSNTTVFLVGLGTTTLASLAVVGYLKPHLEKTLTDLCGTPERARFWSVFSSVTLMLVPLIFALHYQPEDAGTKPTVFMIGSQLEWGLIGLAVSVVVLGYVVGSFIPRSPTKSS